MIEKTLDERVAALHEPRPDKPGEWLDNQFSPGGFWAISGLGWVPAHAWSTDPAEAARLRQEVSDAEPDGPYSSRWEMKKVHNHGVMCEFIVGGMRYTEFGETESEATARVWLAWKGQEVSNG